MFIFGYDIVLDRLERVIHKLVELQKPTGAFLWAFCAI